MYLLALTLIAVLPVPKMSYAAAVRIDQSFQFGTFLIAGKSRGVGAVAPAKFVMDGQIGAGEDCAGTSALK